MLQHHHFDEDDDSLDGDIEFFKDEPIGSLRGDGYGGGGQSSGHGHHGAGNSHGNNTNGNGNNTSDGGNGGLRYRSIAAARNNNERDRDSHNQNKKEEQVIQSHNYEPDESEVWRAYVAQLHFSNRGQWWTTGKKRALKRWALTFLIGVLQGCVACTANYGSRYFSKMKFDTVYAMLERDGMAAASASSSGQQNGDTTSNTDNDNNGYYGTDDLFMDDATMDGYGGTTTSSSSTPPTGFGGSAFVAFLFYQTLFAAIATMFVWIEPVSAGSGIPEIKCYLNGIDLPRVVRVKTLVCKVAGVIFSVAAGLPVGKEGPMVHSGAVVASGISQGKTKCWGVDTSFSKFSDFRNDREKRDFVACGAAAGVCSAFGAPIGGVLFSLEEGASYWSTKLTWRAFFCAMITLGTLFAVKFFDERWGEANVEKLFSFGEFNSIS